MPVRVNPVTRPGMLVGTATRMCLPLTGDTIVRRSIKKAYYEIQDDFDSRSLWRRNGLHGNTDDTEMKKRRVNLLQMCDSEGGLQLDAAAELLGMQRAEVLMEIQWLAGNGVLLTRTRGSDGQTTWKLSPGWPEA